MIKEGLLVGVGAALGALARYGLLLFLAPLSSEVLVTLAINVLGSFVIGLIKPSPFWTTGFLGGFTTFSAFTVALAQASLGAAVLLAVATVVLAVGAFLVGHRIRAGEV